MKLRDHPGTILAVMLVAAVGLRLTGCAAPGATPTAAQAAGAQAGALFCAVQVAGGGAVTVALIDAGVSGAAPGAAPLAVIATGATKAFVDAACAKAGGIPVSPPPDPAAAPVVAVVVPAKGAG